MADETRPLSRRERREMEEQAAAGLTPVPAASTAPESSAGPGPDVLDASAPSRRDRRRLERLEQPMETWTAVEEMHHTGQVPTMTPEVIAQQEELARRRAAEAQADALRATGEIHQVAPDQVWSPAMEPVTAGKPATQAPVPPAPTAPPMAAVEPLAPAGVEPIAPAAVEPIAPAAAEPASPTISRYDMPDETSLAPPARPTPSPADDARRRLAEAAAIAAAEVPAPTERPPAPVRQEHGVIDAPRPATSEVPSLADLTPPSGIRRAQTPPPQGEPAAPPQQAVPGQGAPYPTTGSVPAAYPLGAPPPPSLGGPPSAPAGQPGLPPQGYPLDPAPRSQAIPLAPRSQAIPQAPGAPAVLPVPIAPPIVTAPTLPSTPAAPPTVAAVIGHVVPGPQQGAPGTPPAPSFGPPTGAIAMQGGPPSYPPGTALSPIVTGMLRPVPGATGTIRAIPGAGPMTGTIPRPIIEVQPAGGAKEFGWPHIALLAAAAFVLGLVVWKISGLGG